jgi:hypothetical protein
MVVLADPPVNPEPSGMRSGGLGDRGADVVIERPLPTRPAAARRAGPAMNDLGGRSEQHSSELEAVLEPSP